MRRKGKILTTSLIILLFFIIVLLGAVDLGKFIDHPQVMRKDIGKASVSGLHS